jgi:hypothetical protein
LQAAAGGITQQCSAFMPGNTEKYALAEFQGTILALRKGASVPTFYVQVICTLDFPKTVVLNFTSSLPAP